MTGFGLTAMLRADFTAVVLQTAVEGSFPDTAQPRSTRRAAYGHIDQQAALKVAAGGGCTIFWHPCTAELQDAVEGEGQNGKSKILCHYLPSWVPQDEFVETTHAGKGSGARNTHK